MESHSFRAEIRQLLNILVHSLYTDREIFVRELVSNAADALHRLQFEMLTNRDVLDPDAELAIRIDVGEEGKAITISDTGIGMTLDEITENLGTIAQSGAAAFVERLAEADGEDTPPVEMIGQFGVGFYSAFMVAKEVRVVSRSCQPDAEACEWVSDGEDSFQVGPAHKEHRGTDVTLFLRDTATEFASLWRLEQIAKRHSDFVPFPVYVGDRTVNRQRPPWRQNPQETTEDEYQEFYKHLTLDSDGPLSYAHLVTDAPVDIRSILFVPGRRDRGALGTVTDYGLRLYAKGVLIQERNKEMLPNYLRFVEGVIESEDLPLNISRETVQRNPAVRRIQKALVGRLTRELTKLAEESHDDYLVFWDEFGPFVKEGVTTDPAARDELVPLLRFHTSHTFRQEGREQASLAQYVERSPEDQQAIYYLIGEDLQSLDRSPHLDYFRAHDLEVLYLVDPIDSFLVMALPEYADRPLKSIDDAALELPQEETDLETDAAVPEEEFDRLVTRIGAVLGERVSEVRASKLLRDNPCRLVSPENDPMGSMERVRRLLDQEFEVPVRIIEVNRGHPLIEGLASMVTNTPDDPTIDAAIEQLYENQLLIGGLHPNPASMVFRIQALIEAAVSRERGA